MSFRLAVPRAEAQTSYPPCADLVMRCCIFGAFMVACCSMGSHLRPRSVALRRGDAERPRRAAARSAPGAARREDDALTYREDSRDMTLVGRPMGVRNGRAPPAWPSIERKRSPIAFGWGLARCVM